MSLSGVNPDVDDASRPEPEPGTGTGPEKENGARRRWSIPEPFRLPLAGTLIYLGIRLVSVAVTAFLLGQGHYRMRHWSLLRWMRSSDGGHYRDIAAHGYAYPAGQL